jgi:predicted amidohydrolase
VTRICCQQLIPVMGDLEANRELTAAAIAEGADGGAEVVVLPELVTSGYMFESPAEAASLAITPQAPLLMDWAALAADRELIVAGGFVEAGDDGRTYNSAAVFDATGLRAVYRKTHLWDREKLVFTPGAELPPVIDTHLGRLSVVICYDLEFPELMRTVALSGVQLVLAPVNWPLMERPDGERPAEALITMATARTNHMAIAVADRAGVERGQAWTAGTTIVGADGWVAGEDRLPGPLYGEVDLELARDKRFTELADAFADRRPELYGAVTAEPIARAN